ncbi:MAG TPA: hypothetical protein PKE00_14805 [Planctomycetota bacterium]|nr:hypothetical protein [Planctomycetota bacterium]
MILTVIIGIGLRVYLDWQQAPIIGLLVGLIIARLVPTKSVCKVKLGLK